MTERRTSLLYGGSAGVALTQIVPVKASLLIGVLMLAGFVSEYVGGRDDG